MKEVSGLASVRVVTDSTANLPDELVALHRIEVVPLQVLFGAESFRDGIDISRDQFFRRLKEAKELPKTSQPSAGEFAETYRRLTADGSSVVSIHISNRLSGTVASAQTAQGMLPDARISVVDTLTASMAHGLALLRAAEAATAGAPHDEVVAIAQDVASRAQLYFVVDTLEYLHKGGRIGGATALVGSLVSIKPVLTVRDGRVETFEKVRTKARAVDRLLDIIGDESAGGSLHLAVLHAGAPTEAASLEERIRTRYQPAEILTGEVGPVIATHTGPGVVGAAFYVDR